MPLCTFRYQLPVSDRGIFQDIAAYHLFAINIVKGNNSQMQTAQRKSSESVSASETDSPDNLQTYAY